MHSEVTQRQKDQDWIIKCAAVSDYRPAQAFEGKLKKSSEVLNLELEPTQDILAYLSEHKPKGQKLIGFAAQSDELIPNAIKKLQKKNLDMICANYLSTSGKADTAITVIKAKDQENPVQLDGPKELVAHKIIDQIKEL
jgi:phosphopantothenoylcysteine decarboxylase/phosphopantothenate--cysteine ligase